MNYFPDFLFEYMDRNGQIKVEVVEVKPGKERYIMEAKSKRDKIALAINLNKWKSASQYCRKLGINFRIVTEKQMFRQVK